MPSPPSAPDSLEQLDVEVGRRLARQRDQPIVRSAAKLGKLGDQEPLYCLAVIIATAGLITRRPQLTRLGAQIATAVGIADLIKTGVKRRVRRSRPHVLLDEGRYETGLEPSPEKKLQSFPSGHMAGAMAAAAAVRRVYPGSTPYGLCACAVLGWNRVSKGAHWPLDVAAGAVVGLVAEALGARLLEAASAGIGRGRLLNNVPAEGETSRLSSIAMRAAVTQPLPTRG